jgi:hypothetical protein
MTLPPLAKLALCVLSGAATLSAQSTAGNWTRLSPAHSPPPEFTLAGMVYDAARHQVVLFGGKTNDAISAETWVWDGSDWTHKTPNTSPPARYGHGMA